MIVRFFILVEVMTISVYTFFS